MYYPQTVLTNESPQVPQRGLYGERYPLTGHFYISLNISLFIFALRVPGKGAPSMFPNRDPHGQGYSVTRATGLFIHSFM